MLPKEKLVKIMRIANQGFNIKPYRSKDYHHTGIFLILYTNLQQQIILSDEEYKKHETNPNGYFCFFYKFDRTQTRDGGNLFFRKNHKVNVTYLPENDEVFVQNRKQGMNLLVKGVNKIIPNLVTNARKFAFDCFKKRKKLFSAWENSFCNYVRWNRMGLNR